MSLGEGLRIDCFSAPARLHSEPGASLEIGRQVYINSGALIFSRQLIRIGDHTWIAEETYLCDTNFHQLTPADHAKTAPIILGRNVWIGRRATILPGVTIGDHAVVGTGAVVTRDVPARTIVAGVPARAVRSFECPDEWLRS